MSEPESVLVREPESVLVRLPVKLFAAYGALEGLARATDTQLTNRILAGQIQAQLQEIERLWNGGRPKS